MASRIPSNKLIQDLNDCIAELKRHFDKTKAPIDDDNATLHRFEEKMETLLLLGLKDKPGLLGVKKSYWEYINSCFSNEKRIHEGIKFVKSLTEVKTSLGRGRAFIRFCLMQKCLADTLQSCFMNLKATKDYYLEKSFFLQKKQWSSFITSLYDLNDLNFDLMACYIELDVSWPSFARKHFFSPESVMLSSRNYSSSSLHSFTSVDDEKYPNSSPFQAQKFSLSNSMEEQETSKLSEEDGELPNQNESLVRKIKFLLEDKIKIDVEMKQLQEECKSLQLQLEAVSLKASETATASMIPVCEICKESVSHSKNINGLFCKQDLQNFEKSPYMAQKIQSLRFRINSNSYLKLHDYFQNEKGQSLKKSLSDMWLNMRSGCEELIKSEEMDNISNESFKRSGLSFSVSCLHELENIRNLEYISNLNEFNSAVQSKECFQYVPKISSLSIEDNVSDNCINTISANNFSQFKIETLFSEMRNIIAYALNNMPELDTSFEKYLLRLKAIGQCIENKLTNEDRCFSIRKTVDKKHADYLENVATVQENVIQSLLEKLNSSLKRSEKLFLDLCNLKNLLRSYGFFKICDKSNRDRNKSELSVKSNSFPSEFCNNLTPEIFSQATFASPLKVLHSSFNILSNLIEKNAMLQVSLDSSLELNSNLISGVQAQELHLKGVTKEIEQAQYLVSVLKEQHRKLQSNEGVLKYDLQEKRKLLNILKEELQTTRKDWNLVRIKNSKSEVEWQNLRKEFVQRHKQTSEESGFVDDKGLEEQNCLHANSLGECENFKESIEVRLDGSNLIDEHKNIFEEPKKSRLEILEEQCQLLYSNLLKGSKRREEIDNRLENMCKTIEKCETSSQNEGLSCKNNCENLDFDTSVDSLAEEMSENNTCDSYNLPASPQLCSNVGSLNSDCSVDALTNYNLAENKSFSFQSSVVDVGNPTLSCNLLSNIDKCITSDTDESMCKSDSLNKVICFPDNQNYIPTCTSTCEFSNKLMSKAQCYNIKSISVGEVDLQTSLKENKIPEKHFASNENSIGAEIAYLKEQISDLEREKIILMQKLEVLKKNSLLVSTELEQTTQQLITCKASKEHEVSALQFQLNTEALKYERALKEFGEQSDGLENMKQKVSEQEHLILTLEEALAEIRSERENEKEHQWQELQELQVSLEASEEECVTLCEDLEKSISYIEEERNKNDVLLSQLEEFKADTQRDKDTLTCELIHLQNDSKQLRKRLVKLLKEKDMLWKRNDYLAYLHKLKISDRWMNDHEVSSCLGCRSKFSFMLRKHHCRHCGRIFCYSCSNNWLLTASSSKQIRVCNECYKQYLEIKIDSRRGSSVSQIDDESEDEDVHLVSHFPLNNISEDRTSVTDSVVSLPVTVDPGPKKNVQPFASTPNLHYVSKHTISSHSKFLDKKTEINDEIKSKRKLFRKSSEVDSNINEIDDDNENNKCEVEIDSSKLISTAAIEASKDGFSGELILNANSKYVLHVLCGKPLTELQWSFYNNNETLHITVFRENDADSCGEKTIYYHSTHKKGDLLILPTPGMYSFCLDSSSRQSVSAIRYLIKAKHLNLQQM